MADQKITDLTAASTVTITDLFEMVRDPGGSPANQKVTLDRLWQAIMSRGGTPPINGDFAWVNQGGASVTATDGTIFLRAPSGGTDSLRIRKKAAPSTPYTITASLIPQLTSPSGNGQTQYAGIGWRQSSDGKLVILAQQIRNLTEMLNQLMIFKFTNETTASAEYTHLTYSQLSPVLWFQITDNGTNRICSVSGDGKNFIAIHTVGRTDFLTADEVMFFATGNTAHEAGLTLVSWDQS